MAKVTITFEDIENEDGDGVEVNMVSDPPWPENPASGSFEPTSAQQMALEMTHLLTERKMQEDSHEHCHDENCTHDHHAEEI